MFPSSITLRDSAGVKDAELRDFYKNRVLPLKVQGEGEMISLRMTLGSTTTLNQIRSFDPSVLFALNEPGQLMEVDPAYLFTDTAGTTPVTAPGQAVALHLDRSKGAGYASGQFTGLGNNVVLNGDFSNGTTNWVAGPGGSISVTNGRLTAVSGGASNIGATQTITPVVGTSYLIEWEVVSVNNGTGAFITFGGASTGILPGAGVRRAVVTAVNTNTLALLGSDANTSVTWDNISVRELPGNHDTQGTLASRPIYGRHPASGYRNLLVNSDTLSTQSRTVTAVAHTLSFKGTGTVTLSGASTAGPLVGTGANDRVTLTFTPTAASLTLTVSGTVTEAQLEVGSTATAYQRTGAPSGLAFPAPVSYDITEAGQRDLHYLHLNGTSSFFVSPTITPGVDKVQVVAGVRKLSDAAFGVVVEFSPDINGNVGSFHVLAPRNVATATYGFASGGGTRVVATSPNNYPSPITNVLTGIGDISEDNATLRVNGAQVAQNTADQGTGNYLAYPLFKGRRGGTTLPFNGLYYGSVIRFGPNLTADQISAVERWMAQRTGVSL